MWLALSTFALAPEAVAQTAESGSEQPPDPRAPPAAPAPRVGTWSAARSMIGFASSDAFDHARQALVERMPGLALVELDALSREDLADLDAVVLDSMIEVPPSPAELEALRAFVASGGSVVAQVYGASGNALAGLYELAVVGTPGAEVNRLPITPGVRSVALSGPFGPVATYANRYEASIGTTNPKTEALPLVHGPSGAVHVVYVPRTEVHGGALLLTNLFAFGDTDWSVGGLADGDNDNLALLGNFLAGAVRPRAPARSLVGWQADYLQATSAAVRGDLAPLEAWLGQDREDPAAEAVAAHAAAWLAEPPEVGADPRFFPLDGVSLGETSRKELRKTGKKPNRTSKWTFDVGPVEWTCVETQQDLCDLVSVRAEAPAVWAALGIDTAETPEALRDRFRRLGYKVDIGVASVSPFGRQVVARGFGVLWQADFALEEQGEQLLDLSARRIR
jgi:hypothetical protein